MGDSLLRRRPNSRLNISSRSPGICFHTAWVNNGSPAWASECPFLGVEQTWPGSGRNRPMLLPGEIFCLFLRAIFSARPFRVALCAFPASAIRCTRWQFDGSRVFSHWKSSCRTSESRSDTLSVKTQSDYRDRVDHISCPSQLAPIPVLHFISDFRLRSSVSVIHTVIITREVLSRSWSFGPEEKTRLFQLYRYIAISACC